MKTTEALTNKFYSKTPLKAYIVTQPNGIDNFLQLAKDRDETGKKSYHYLPCNGVEKIKELLKTNTHLYELLPPDVPVKPYFDLEIERDGITSHECEDLLREFINIVTNEYQTKYDVTLEQEDFVILNACRANKLSYHLIIQNKLYFQSVIAHKQFILQFHRVIQGKDSFLWNSKKGEHKTIMDIAPYSTDQCIRCINQSKMSNNFLLKNDNIDPIDSLIRLYWGVGDRRMIEYNEGEGLIKSRGISDKKRKTKQHQAHETDVMELYETEGITLLEAKELTYTDLRELPEWKQYLNLIPNTAQNRQVFMSIGYCLRNCGGSQEDWREWAKLSPKYTQGSQIANFPSFQTGERAYQLSFLKTLAQKAHPFYFDEGQRLLYDEYLKPNYTGMKIIDEDCEFVSQEDTIHENNILINKKLILLVARLGGGKTIAINRLIQNRNYKRILFVSPRTTFSYFVAKEFGLTVYLDENANLHDDKLVISVESLWKLKEQGVKPYDLIVLDEIEANLSVFSSSTLKKQLPVYNYLTELIKESKQTITAGAFITQKTINFLLSFKLPTVCIRNTTPPKRRKAVEVSPDYFALKLMESIKKGEKNFVCYSSLRQMNAIISILNGSDDPIVTEVMKSALLYSSEGDDKKQKEELQNMGVEWKNARLVITSPTITVGNSYTICDFDNVFICSSPTCIVADIFQCHRRVRYLTKDTLYFSLPSQGSKTFNKRFFQHKLEILRNFNDRNELKTQLTVKLLKELKEKKDYQQYKNEAEDKRIDLETLLENLENRHQSPKALQDLLISNYQENTLSQCYYDEMFIEFLRLNNYDTILLPTISKKDKDIMDAELHQLEEKSVSNHQSFQDIPTIQEGDLAELKKKVNHKEATRLEKLQIEAYYFKANTNITPEQLYENMENLRNTDIKVTPELEKFYDDTHGTNLTLHDIFNADIDSETLSKYAFNLWFKEYNNSHNKHYYDNFKAEINDSLVSSLKSVIDKAVTTNETLSSKPVKLEFIRTINRKLGIPNTGTTLLDKEVIIEREQLEKVTPYIQQEYDNILITFGLSKLKGDKFDVKQTISLISKIYYSWNRCDFESIKDKHKKVKALKLKPHPSYSLFTPFVKQQHEKLQGCMIRLDEEEIKPKENLVTYVIEKPIQTKGAITEFFQISRKVK